MAPGKIFTIRLNEREEAKLNNIKDLFGLDSQGAALKACLPWAVRFLDDFLDKFENVIHPLKSSEIDMVISTMSIRAKQAKKQRKALERVQM